MKWERGRQSSEYYKLRLFEIHKPIIMDCYLMRFPLYSWLPDHRDPIADAGYMDYAHYRLNFELRRAKAGGRFMCRSPIFSWWRIHFFRPDITTHSVTAITKGERLVLSVGWLIKK